jgi:hypothetical protein
MDELEDNICREIAVHIRMSTSSGNRPWELIGNVSADEGL